MARAHHTWQQSLSSRYVQEFSTDYSTTPTSEGQQQFSFFQSQVNRPEKQNNRRRRKAGKSRIGVISTRSSSGHRSYSHNIEGEKTVLKHSGFSGGIRSYNNAQDTCKFNDISTIITSFQPQELDMNDAFFPVSQQRTPTKLPKICQPRSPERKQNSIQIMASRVNRLAFTCGCMTTGICVHYMWVLNGLAQDGLVCPRCTHTSNTKQLSVDRPCRKFWSDIPVIRTGLRSLLQIQTANTGAASHNNPRSTKYIPNLAEDFSVNPELLERAAELYQRTWDCSWSNIPRTTRRVHWRAPLSQLHIYPGGVDM